MGRENMEDYNADFLCMLETWEAGLVFWPSIDGKTAQPLEIARLLGWDRLPSDRQRGAKITSTQ